MTTMISHFSRMALEATFLIPVDVHQSYSSVFLETYCKYVLNFLITRAALTGKHDTLVRRAHQMLNAALLITPCRTA